jgi:HK97 family phage major capsid protein
MSKATKKAHDLALLIAELRELDDKNELSPTEKRRHASLLGQMAAVRDGASLEALRIADHNERAREQGFEPITKKPRTLTLSKKEEREARAFKEFVINGPHFGGEVERRTDIENVPLTTNIGTYSNLGFFSPTGYQDDLVMALAEINPLVDPNSGVTFINSENGRLIEYPLLDDTSVNNEITPESSQANEGDLAHPGHLSLAAYSFRSKKWPISLETLQDLPDALSAKNLFMRVVSVRIARQFGYQLVQGSGSGTIFGLLPSLIAAGATIRTAQGANANSGSSGDNSTNSIGSDDLFGMVGDLSGAYVEDPTCAFLMQRATLVKILSIKDQIGHPANIAKEVKPGRFTIAGIPVMITPSMPGIAPSSHPVILGSLRFWCTRVVNDNMTGIMLFKEGASMIEHGVVSLQSTFRGDGGLLFSGVTGASCPFTILQMHS